MPPSGDCSRCAGPAVNWLPPGQSPVAPDSAGAVAIGSEVPSFPPGESLGVSRGGAGSAAFRPDRSQGCGGIGIRALGSTDDG